MMQWVAILNAAEASSTLRSILWLRDKNGPRNANGYAVASCEAVAHWGRDQKDPCGAIVRRALQARHSFPIDVRVRYYRTGVMSWS
jgi:hypothetical protein